MAINWHVGDVVEKLREADKRTQEQLAKLAKIRPATISAIESTGKHEPETLQKIADALKVTVAEIHSLVPRNRIEPAPILASACPDNNPDHIRMLENVEQALHDGVTLRAMQMGMAALVEMRSPTPEKKQDSAITTPKRRIRVSD